MNKFYLDQFCALIKNVKGMMFEVADKLKLELSQDHK